MRKKNRPAPKRAGSTRPMARRDSRRGKYGKRGAFDSSPRVNSRRG